MQDTKAEQGPQNFTSAPQQYVHPPPQPYPQQGGPLPPTEWSTGLYDCTEDQSVCCVTCWCPCITFGQIAEIVDEGSPSCSESGRIYGFSCCFSSCFYRTKIRAKFNLPDVPCADCLVHCFCEPCALCQEYRELKYRGLQPALGWKGNLPRQQQGMGTAMTAPAYVPTMAR